MDFDIFGNFRPPLAGTQLFLNTSTLLNSLPVTAYFESTNAYPANRSTTNRSILGLTNIKI